jgi:hypothetical protein
MSLRPSALMSKPAAASGCLPRCFGVAGEHGCDEGVGGGEPGWAGAEGEKLAGQLGVAADEGDFDRRAAARTALLGEGADDVDAVLGEQGDAAALVVGDGPGQQAAQHLAWRLE